MNPQDAARRLTEPTAKQILQRAHDAIMAGRYSCPATPAGLYVCLTAQGGSMEAVERACMAFRIAVNGRPGPADLSGFLRREPLERIVMALAMAVDAAD